MKTYRLTGANGKPYTLSGVTNDVKTNILDVVKAKEKMGCIRQLKRGLLDAEGYERSMQTVNGIKFSCEAVIGYLSSEEGARELIRELIAHGGKCAEPTDEDVAAVYDAQKAEGSDAWVALQSIMEDAVPKDETPPTTMTPTSGGGCSTIPTPESPLTTSAA